MMMKDNICHALSSPSKVPCHTLNLSSKNIFCIEASYFIVCTKGSLFHCSKFSSKVLTSSFLIFCVLEKLSHFHFVNYLLLHIEASSLLQNIHHFTMCFKAFIVQAFSFIYYTCLQGCSLFKLSNL